MWGGRIAGARSAEQSGYDYSVKKKGFSDMESQIESVKALDAYRLRQVKHIPELNSDGMILEHKKTGANIFLMSNEDDNKVFCIGFRTPPSDSTGVPHIIEHTVLCGSDKFPVKDPFVELVKGSLNTFLNAMTMVTGKTYTGSTITVDAPKNQGQVRVLVKDWTGGKLIDDGGAPFIVESLDSNAIKSYWLIKFNALVCNNIRFRC